MSNDIAKEMPSAAVTNGRLLKRVVVLVIWSGIMLLALRFLARDAFKYFGFDEATFGRFWTHRFWLIAHIVGGISALLLGPFQFWSGLRRRALRFHRWMGRVYVLGVVLAAGSAFRLSFFIPPSDGGWVVGLSLFALAAVWLTSAAMAIRSIRNGRVETHKEWMIRSYVLTFAFVNFRWWMDLPFISTLGTPTERLTAVVWTGWTLPLFITEVVLQWKRAGRQIR
jgi:uncharacterized membrane protein